mgnify:CR=1 FL=1
MISAHRATNIRESKRVIFENQGQIECIYEGILDRHTFQKLPNGNLIIGNFCRTYGYPLSLRTQRIKR